MTEHLLVILVDAEFTQNEERDREWKDKPKPKLSVNAMPMKSAERGVAELGDSPKKKL